MDMVTNISTNTRFFKVKEKTKQPMVAREGEEAASRNGKIFSFVSVLAPNKIEVLVVVYFQSSYFIHVPGVLKE